MGWLSIEYTDEVFPLKQLGEYCIYTDRYYEAVLAYIYLYELPYITLALDHIDGIDTDWEPYEPWDGILWVEGHQFIKVSKQAAKKFLKFIDSVSIFGSYTIDYFDQDIAPDSYPLGYGGGGSGGVVPARFVIKKRNKQRVYLPELHLNNNIELLADQISGIIYNKDPQLEILFPI